MPSAKPAIPVCLALLIPLLTAGCSELGYYSQAIDGHLSLMAKRQPVKQLLDSADTPADLRQQLQLSTELLRFAHTTLHLPDNGSYRSYIHTDAPYVVWNVYAAPALSLEAMQWCVPLVVGCTVYRGWFDAADASEQARELQQQGYDTFVGGVTAYSTLGWFSDPLLSTFFGRSEWRTAALLFHELAHQRLYVAGDSTFNESFATALEREATRRWLQQHGSAQQLAEAQQYWDRLDRRTQLFDAARQELRALYQSDVSPAARRQAKQAIFTRLHTETAWGDPTKHALNNATLAALGAYTHRVPAFQQLLRDQKGNLEQFYLAAERLGALPEAQREQQLAALTAAANRPKPAD